MIVKELLPCEAESGKCEPEVVDSLCSYCSNMSESYT